MTHQTLPFARPSLRPLRGATALLGLSLALLLGACSSLPDRPTRPVTYDFGPGPLATAPTDRMAPLAPIALADVEPTGVLDGSTAVLYRLAYSNAQTLLPYAQSRWSMPVAQLVRQRLRDYLGQRRAVLTAGESSALVRTNGALPLVLRVDLDEFSHIFDSPTTSAGLVRLRVTLVDVTPAGEKLLGQRQIIVQRPAATNDAPGGVAALALATDAAAQEIADWIDRR